VTADITLYAKWQPVEVASPTTSLVFERNADGYTVTGASGQEEKIIIPAEYEGLPVTEIGESAFAYSRHTSDITSVSIPDSVTAIGLNAFYSRSELEIVDIGGDSALTTIGRNAFSGNRSLKSIYVPKGVIDIGDSAFNNCGALDSISVAAQNTAYSGEGNNLIEKATNTLIRGSNNSIIPSTVTTIAQAAFRRATTITTLAVPISVTTIGNYFIADSTITTIDYAGMEEQWNEIEKGSLWNFGKTDITIVCSTAPSSVKVLVAYFSCTNTTKSVAEAIHSQVSYSDIYRITPAVPYTSADLNYNTDCRANREQNDSTARPEISGSVDNIAQYGVIFIGYPIWWGQAPKIIYTFFESYNYDFDGVTIIPFCTSGSSPMGTSATNLHNLAPKADWKSGARISGTNVSSLISQMQ
ncbi:MAG: leucine-rich repeat protein, partial [Clostridiales bacterium]|nr:leucine-rich repeat protein [Clostridiales bacterium]